MIVCEEEKIKLYQNKDWLQKKYIDEEWSTCQISKLCNTSSTTVWNWIKKFNIAGRSVRDANHLKSLRLVNHCKLSPEAMEWIHGELLGDGCLYSSSNYSANFLYSSSKEKYINYVSNTLKSFGIAISHGGKISRNSAMIGNYGPYVSFDYTSLSYSELLPIRKHWYPHGKKNVPRDIKLTPLTCRQWYIGDGTLSRSGVSSSIVLYTEGFPIPDVEWLVKELIKLGFKTTRYHSSNVIHISAYSTKDFLNYIGPCPVKCYEYKWKYKGEKKN